MKFLQKQDIEKILLGSSLLGTGGGGTFKSAKRLTNQVLKPVKMVSLGELKKDAFICSVFGIGSTQNCNPIIASRNALELFIKVNNKEVAAIIPVEIGPESLATAFFIASKLNLPILDSDIVGLRSSPEIYLETITLKNISRTPCAVSDDKKNSLVLWQCNDYLILEKVLRDFAVSVGGDAFVAGYPLIVSAIKNLIPKNSISIAQRTGQLLEELRNEKINMNQFLRKSGWILFGTGVITSAIVNNSSGFTKGKYTIKSGKNSLTILFKNENIILFKNKKLVFTCPDSLSLLDLDIFEGVNNFENNKGKKVTVLGKKAIPIWRTKKGKKLFHPKVLGFNYNQKLLE